MFLKARKIRIIGDQSVQLEVTVPKKSTQWSVDLPGEPSEVIQSLEEMGWKEVEQRQPHDEYDLVTMEYKSYPLQHRILVECEKAINCPIKSSVGNPKDWKISGRIVIPSTVIESEWLMGCVVTDDQIKCSYPVSDLSESKQTTRESKYQNISIYDDENFDGTLFIGHDVKLGKNDHIESYRIEAEFFPQSQTMELDSLVDWEIRKKAIFQEINDANELIGCVISRGR